MLFDDACDYNTLEEAHLFPSEGDCCLKLSVYPTRKTDLERKRKRHLRHEKHVKLWPRYTMKNIPRKQKRSNFDDFGLRTKKKKKKNLQTKIAISTVRCTRRCIREKVGARSKPSSPVQSFFFFIYSLAPENSYWNESISSLSAGFRPPVHCTHLLPHPRSSNDDELPA